MSDKSDAGTVTNRHRQSLRMSCDRALHIFSSFLVPLLLSIFTIYIAVYQQKVANDNRRIDIKIAEEQRAAGYKLAKGQREADHNVSVQRAQEDRIDAEERRNLDRKVANKKIEADQNSSSLQRKQELTVEETRREIARQDKEEAILDHFIRDLSTLLTNSNGSFSLKMLNIVRWKTLVVIRQLDGKRKALLLIYLFESGLIMRSGFAKSPLILANANFDSLDMRSEKIERPNDDYDSPSFRGMSLVNAMFDDNQIQGSDFAFTRLVGASFRNSEIGKSTFYYADLRNSTFEGANVFACDFTGANLVGSDLTQLQLNDVTFLKDAILPDGSKGVQTNLIYFAGDDSSMANLDPYTHFSRVWSIYRDEVEDPNAQISFIAHNSHGLVERKYWAYAKHRIVLASTKPFVLWHKYLLWIPSNQLKMRVKGRCTAKATNTSVSFRMHLTQEGGSPVIIFFGSTIGNTLMDIDNVFPMPLRVTYTLEITFERSEPSPFQENIGFCEDIHVGIDKTDS